MKIYNDFDCYDLVMAQELCRKGHKIIYVKPNKKEQGRIIFQFSFDEEGLKEDIEAFFEEKRMKKEREVNK